VAVSPEYLDHALRDAGRIELRHQDGDRWTSGVFDDPFALRRSISEIAERGNCFATLNEPGDVPVTNAMSGRALRDEQFERFVRIPFDFDPARPAGMPSTDGELAAARERRNSFVQAMSALGWPAPAVAVSGNGAHALYRCRLPNSTETREALAALYRGLQAEFSDDAVSFDTTVRNPARIWRLYGTRNRKGTPTAGRPHRMSAVMVPSRWDALSPRAIDALANRYARVALPIRQRRCADSVYGLVGSGDYRSLDIIGWLSAHGLYKRALGQGKHAVRCPWAAEHSVPDSPHDTSTVAWEPDPGMWPTWHCSHSHCEGRSIVDVMRRLGDADRFCATAWRRV
jgi:hypothetical protein